MPQAKAKLEPLKWARQFSRIERIQSGSTPRFLASELMFSKAFSKACSYSVPSTELRAALGMSVDFVKNEICKAPSGPFP